MTEVSCLPTGPLSGDTCKKNSHRVCSPPRCCDTVISSTCGWGAAPRASVVFGSVAGYVPFLVSPPTSKGLGLAADYLGPAHENNPPLKESKWKVAGVPIGWTSQSVVGVGSSGELSVQSAGVFSPEDLDADLLAKDEPMDIMRKVQQLLQARDGKLWSKPTRQPDADMTEFTKSGRHLLHGSMSCRLCKSREKNRVVDP